MVTVTVEGFITENYMWETEARRRQLKEAKETQNAQLLSAEGYIYTGDRGRSHPLVTTCPLFLSRGPLRTDK